VSIGVPLTRSAPDSPEFSDGNSKQRVANEILLGLPRKEYKTVFPRLEWVNLPVPTVLNEVATPIEHGYFMNSGLASILTVLSGAKSVEVGLAGSEGFVGVPLIAGFRTSPARVIVQIDGSGFRISAKDLVRSLRECPVLVRSLQQYSQEMALQSMQVAACNRLHDVNQRLARWLLMSQDRVGGNVVKLTQEFLAHMLGTRRASVTVAAGVLQKAGMITYSRGAVTIENRAGMEGATCECYAAINRQSRMWENESKSSRELPLASLVVSERIFPRIRPS
jgi:CRP-like cAMP-binding protein